ncbi:MAG: tRNA lysidine(34) synthetase TilS [Candidatus Sulfotelmatobacter sp.]
MHSLPERVLSHVRRLELLNAGERVGVAVSGGLDSLALLRLLLELRGELGIVLSVVHFNHKLRGAESDLDQAFVAALAREHGLEFYCEAGDVGGHAAQERVSIESAARELRYAFFHRLLGANGPQGLKPDENDGRCRGPEGPLFHGSEEPASRSSDGGPLGRPPSQYLHKIATGHTLDDQAETVLLRVIRGAGLRGLAGIHPTLVVEDDEGEVYGEIVRPLLTTRRRDLECYLRELGQSWRDDATNLSTKFTRNRVRHLLLPLLEKEFNPSVAETLGDVAQIARGEEDYWDNEVAGWMGTAVHWSEPAWAKKSELVQIRGNGGTQAEADATLSDLKANIGDVPWLVMNASVNRLWLLGEALAVQRRVIKAIGDEAGIPLEFKHIEEIVRFAVQEAGSGGEISLPLGWKVRRDAHQIIFETPNRSEVGPAGDYEYELPVPGEVTVCEIGSTLEASRVAANAGYNPEHLLDGESLHAPLKVRNWRAGDRFWPRHTKSPKKVKELLQERHLPRAERSLWPVIVSGEEIVWVRGFSVAARFAARAGREAVAIVERTIGSERL